MAYVLIVLDDDGVVDSVWSPEEGETARERAEYIEAECLKYQVDDEAKRLFSGP